MGARAADDLSTGMFVMPAIANVSNDSPLAQEEIFGPVAEADALQRLDAERAVASCLMHAISIKG